MQYVLNFSSQAVGGSFFAASSDRSMSQRYSEKINVWSENLSVLILNNTFCLYGHNNRFFCFPDKHDVGGDKRRKKKAV